MTEIKAVIMDYIGTLANARNYSLETSRMKLRRTLTEAGFETRWKAFLVAYNKAHEKYRVVRYKKLKEVTNAVWVSEALNELGCKTREDDPRVKAALNAFFQDYVDSLELRDGAENLLDRITMENCKLGLISNFTYAPVIYASLRKLGIDHFFNSIVVSEETGWRKPHKRIFQTVLQRLGVTAVEAVYVGDSPLEDIEGAKKVGMKTVFVPSQFNSLQDLHASRQQPDVTAGNLQEVAEALGKIVNTK
jgi:HAD superfamily hydrolase (TIGR01549 family)